MRVNQSPSRILVLNMLEYGCNVLLVEREWIRMTTEMMTIQVPELLYRRLERLAALTHRPLESLVLQTLSSSIPPLPDDLPTPNRDALTALEDLGDDALWQLTRGTFPDHQYEQFTVLREKRRAGALTPDEQATLDRLTAEADLLTLQKAYAAVLLKWRGHRLPTLAEREAQP
jgi:hypothetical protein